MPSSSERRRRGPDGRFASRGGPTQKMMVRRQGVGQLALLTPAILFGLIGFAVPVCWIAALVLLGILLESDCRSSPASDRGPRRVCRDR